MLRALACILSGTLYFLAVAPWNLSLLAWVALVPLLGALRGVSVKRGFLLGWLMGFTMNAGGFFWMWATVARLGGLPEPLAFLTWVVIEAYQGLLYGLFGAAFVWLGARPVVAAPLLVALEQLFWMPFAYSFAISQAWQVPVIQVAELGGPAAVTCLLMLVNASVYGLLWVRPRPWLLSGVTVALLAATLAFGQWRLGVVDAERTSAPRFKVGLAQANLPLRSLYQGGVVAPAGLNKLRRLSAELERQGADLVVWSESEYPYLLLENQTRDIDVPAGSILHGVRGPLIAGVRRQLGSGGRTTSAVLVAPGGDLRQTYDKHQLVPFGEYIPLLTALGLGPAEMRGVTGRQLTLLEWDKARMGVLICLEDILPDFCRSVCRLKPNCLINLTNDQWFGATGEPYQHLALEVFRCVEQRLDMARCTKNGVSAFVDAGGRVVQLGPLVDPYAGARRPEPTPLLGDLALLSGQGYYQHVGPVLPWTMVLLSLGLLWRQRRIS